MSVYKTATNEAPKWSTLTVRTRETVSKHSHRGKNKSKADVLGASASILSPTVSKVKASKVTAMKDLIVTHSSSVQAAKSPNVHNSLPQVAKVSISRGKAKHWKLFVKEQCWRRKLSRRLNAVQM